MGEGGQWGTPPQLSLSLKLLLQDKAHRHTTTPGFVNLSPPKKA